MDIGSAIGLGLLVSTGIFLCSLYIQRYRYKRNLRAGRNRLGFYPTATSLGNALHNLQQIAQPRIENFITERFEDEADEDEDGNPDNATKHFLRQLRRIRNGEQLDSLTASIPQRRVPSPD